jgi:hypothetical protein
MFYPHSDLDLDLRAYTDLAHDQCMLSRHPDNSVSSFRRRQLCGPAIITWTFVLSRAQKTETQRVEMCFIEASENESPRFYQIRTWTPLDNRHSYAQEFWNHPEVIPPTTPGAPLAAYCPRDISATLVRVLRPGSSSGFLFIKDGVVWGLFPFVFLLYMYSSQLKFISQPLAA